MLVVEIIIVVEDLTTNLRKFSMQDAYQTQRKKGMKNGATDALLTMTDYPDDDLL